MKTIYVLLWVFIFLFTSCKNNQQDLGIVWFETTVQNFKTSVSHNGILLKFTLKITNNTFNKVLMFSCIDKIYLQDKNGLELLSFNVNGQTINNLYVFPNRTEYNVLTKTLLKKDLKEEQLDNYLKGDLKVVLKEECEDFEHLIPEFKREEFKEKDYTIELVKDIQIKKSKDYNYIIE